MNEKVDIDTLAGVITILLSTLLENFYHSRKFLNFLELSNFNIINHFITYFYIIVLQFISKILFWVQKTTLPILWKIFRTQFTYMNVKINNNMISYAWWIWTVKVRKIQKIETGKGFFIITSDNNNSHNMNYSPQFRISIWWNTQIRWEKLYFIGKYFIENKTWPRI